MYKAKSVFGRQLCDNLAFGFHVMQLTLQVTGGYNEFVSYGIQKDERAGSESKILLWARF